MTAKTVLPFEDHTFKDFIFEINLTLERIESIVNYIKQDPDASFSKMLLDEIMLLINEIDYMLDVCSLLDIDLKNENHLTNNNILSDTDQVRVKQLLNFDDVKDAEGFAKIIFDLVDKVVKENIE